MKLNKASKVFILLGVASLHYWPKILHGGRLSLIRFETFFAAAVLSAILYFLADPFRENKTDLSAGSEQGLHLVLIFLPLSILLATLLSLVRYGLWFDLKGLVIFVKIVLGICLFLVVREHLKEDTHFYKKLALAFYIPSLLLLVFFIYPKLTEYFPSVVSGYPGFKGRFQGFTSNPALAAQLCMIAFSFVFTSALFDFYRKKLLLAGVYFLFSAGMVGLIFWTLTRTYLISCTAIMIFGTVLVNMRFEKSIKKLLVVLSTMTLSVPAIFFALPSSIRDGYTSRIQTFLHSPETEPRFVLWKYFLGLLPWNPIGIGLNYEQTFFVEWYFPEKMEVWRLGPHSVLDLWMLGGIFAFCAVGYLIYRIIKRVRLNLESLDDSFVSCYIGSLGAFFGLWISSLFTGSPITFMGFWVLLAMCLI